MGVRKDISDIVNKNNWPDAVSDVLYRTLMYVERRQIYGCCHLLSSVLYVALCELGLSPNLYIGECQFQTKGPSDRLLVFDHSWVCLDNKVIDIAISMPLPYTPRFCGVIIGDIDIETGMHHMVKYGAKSDIGFDSDTKQILSCSFKRYMDMFPGERRGAWTIVGRILNKTINVDELQHKYGNTVRQIYNADNC